MVELPAHSYPLTKREHANVHYALTGTKLSNPTIIDYRHRILDDIGMPRPSHVAATSFQKAELEAILAELIKRANDVPEGVT